MLPYLKHAFFSAAHPLAILSIVVLLVLAPVTWNLWATLACGAASLFVDAVVVAVVSCTPACRRAVDERIAERARQDAAQATRTAWVRFAADEMPDVEQDVRPRRRASR